VLGVLKWYNGECDKARYHEGDETYAEYQRTVLQMDLVLFDFLRVKFPFAGRNDADMYVIGEAIPLPPTDEYYTAKSSALHRVPLNGFVVELGRLIIDSRMFEYKIEFGPLRNLMPEIPIRIVDALLKYQGVLDEFDTRVKLPPGMVFFNCDSGP
jgi:hypothetical protein